VSLKIQEIQDAFFFDESVFETHPFLFEQALLNARSAERISLGKRSVPVHDAMARITLLIRIGMKKTADETGRGERKKFCDDPVRGHISPGNRREEGKEGMDWFHVSSIQGCMLD